MAQRMEVDGHAENPNDNLIVGEEGCKIGDIAKIFANDEAACEHWLDLASDVGLVTPASKKLSIKQKDKNDDTFSKMELFRELLTDWKARRGREATLTSLLRLLANAGENWTGSADKIREKFLIAPDLR